MTPPTSGLAELDLAELERLLQESGYDAFHARQLYRWIHRRGVTDFEQMTNLSKELRSELKARFTVGRPQVVSDQLSTDGTRKFVLEMSDGRRIETVFIPDTPAMTFCVSTQVGCAMSCGFCLTGKMGLVRHLTAGEIVGQVITLASATGLLEQPFNIVLMGMGEPLHNYDNTMKALRMLHAEEGLSISPRRITLSTVGIVPGLERLAREPLMPNLAISLHATTEEQRTALVPPNAKYLARGDSRRVPAVSPEEAQPHHLRVRAAQRGQRHTRGRTETREAALRDQGQGQPDTTQCRTGNPVRAALGCTRRSIRADPRRPASHRLGEKEPWSRYPGRMRSADCGRRIEEIGRPADGATAALTPTSRS